MKIAYCIGALNLGGIGTVANNLRKYFEDKNVCFDIITTHHQGNFFSQALEEGWPVKDISKNEPSLKLRMKNVYNELIKYDVLINNHSDEVKFILPALPSGQVKITVQHNTTSASAISLSWNSKFLNFWAGVSPAVVEVINKHNPEFQRLAVLPNGVPGFPGIQNAKSLERKIRLAYIGRLDQQQKNIFIIPELIAQLEKSDLEVELLIAGDGSDAKNLKKLIKQKKIKSSVVFLGRVDKAGLASIFSKSDFLLNLSFYEGLPMIVLEAMSGGVVPILSPIDPHRYAIGEELEKLLLKGDNVETYAEVIFSIQRDDISRKEISKKLFDRWEKEFSIGAFGKKYEDLIVEALKKPLQYKPVKLKDLKLPKKEKIKLSPLYTLVQKFYRTSR